MDISELECELYDVDGHQNVEGWMWAYVGNGPHAILDYIHYYQRVKVWI